MVAHCPGRGPQGPRGLKYEKETSRAKIQSRGPQGPRGLKCLLFRHICICPRSRSARTARIEISPLAPIPSTRSRSRSARTARIEISSPLDPVDEPESRSARTARIEISVSPSVLMISRSRSARTARIEISVARWSPRDRPSRSARTARIEMPAYITCNPWAGSVAVRKDRED